MRNYNKIDFFVSSELYIQMPQPTLHTFFGGINTSVPTWFVLDYDPIENICKARFVRSEPSDISSVCQVGWRATGKKIFIGMTTSASQLPIWGDREGTSCTSVPMLKSLIQKCVRRGRADLAVSAAYNLALLDPLALFRRWPIVAVEDALPLLGLTECIWAMAACYGRLNIPEILIYQLLSDVHHASELSVTKVFPASTKTDTMQLNNISEIFQSNVEIGSLLYALLYRKANGGTAFDMGLLMNCTDSLTLTHQRVIQPRTPIRSFDTIKLGPTTWELAAVDQHCSCIIQMLKATLPQILNGISTEELGGIMWRKSGGVSFKRTVLLGTNTQDDEIWKSIYPTVVRLAKRIVAKCTS